MLSFVKEELIYACLHYICPMTTRNRWLLVTCLLAVAGLVVLQLVWIRHYYRVSLFNLEREVNLAFEDAVKKEF